MGNNNRLFAIVAVGADGRQPDNQSQRLAPVRGTRNAKQ